MKTAMVNINAAVSAAVIATVAENAKKQVIASVKMAASAATILSSKQKFELLKT